MLLHSFHICTLLSKDGLKSVFYAGTLLLLSCLAVVPTLIGVGLTSSILVVLSLPSPLGLIGILVARLPLVVVLCLTGLILLIPFEPRHIPILVLATAIGKALLDWNVL